MALSADWRFDAAQVLRLVDQETARTGKAIPETLSRQYRLLKRRERCSLHLADRLLCEMLGRPDLFQELQEEPGWDKHVTVTGNGKTKAKLAGTPREMDKLKATYELMRLPAV